MERSHTCWYPLAVLLLVIGTAAEPQYPLACAAGHNEETSEIGWRDAQCGLCHCCPRRWSCAELLAEAYNCSARVGLELTETSIDMGNITQGHAIHWDLVPPNAPKYGWLQCYAWPALYGTGLEFHDNGTITGTVALPEHRDEGAVQFFAVNAYDWERFGVRILRLSFSLDPQISAGNSASQGQSQTRMHADNAYRAYARWEKRMQGAAETITDMSHHLGLLRDLLIAQPTTDNGIGWSWLGGFHMNIHKLMENVLFECELYLGQALLFANPEVQQMANRNLDGCFAKRRLEAAKFLVFDGLKFALEGKWEQAERKFEESCKLKDGWGWGFNVGEPFLALGSVLLVKALGSNDASATASLIASGNSKLQTAQQRNPDYHFTRIACDLGSKMQEANQRGDAEGFSSARHRLEQEFKQWGAEVLRHHQPRYRPAAVAGLPWKTAAEHPASSGVEAATAWDEEEEEEAAAAGAEECQLPASEL